MKIEFADIVPKPLAATQFGEDSIWNNSFFIDFSDKTLLNASSGKGKTTFLHILYGLRSDYSGRILFQNQNIRQFDLDRWTSLRRDVFSVVFQDLQLFPNLSTEENLRIKWDLGSDLNFDEIVEMLGKLGLADKLNQMCGTLSFGQQQRVAIVRALIPKFKYLLMDEPFSHLDQANKALALELILERCDQLQTGCLMTTLGESYSSKFNKMLYL